MSWSNTLTNPLKITYPIIQAPMLGVSTPEMAAAVSNAGGLGSLAVGGLSPELSRRLIQQTKRLTSKPFAVNLFVHDLPAYRDEDLEPMRTLLLQLAHKKGYSLTAEDLSDFHFYTYRDQIQVLLEEAVSIISFTFGCLDAASIRVFKDKGCVLMGTATCVEEAQILQAQDIDMIVVQGIEAGGHRGTFIDNIPLPQVELFSLLDQIKNALTIPCIAAGGINNAQTIYAAFQRGAVAVQVGTAFIGTTESEAIASYKQKVNKSTASDSTLTRAFSGRWARGLSNELMKEIEASGISIPAYPLQNSLTAKLRKLSQQAGDSEYTNLWAGQSEQGAALTSTAEVFRKLVEQYEKLYS